MSLSQIAPAGCATQMHNGSERGQRQYPGFSRVSTLMGSLSI